MAASAFALLLLQSVLPNVEAEGEFARLTTFLEARFRPPMDAAERGAWAEQMLQNPGDEAAAEAATRVLALDLPVSLPTLEKLATDSRWRARAAALDAGVRGAPLVKDSRDLTRLRELGLRAAKDPARAVRRNAARVLAEVGDSAEPVLDKLANDTFYDVRIEAIRALVRGGSTDTIPWIAEHLHDPDRQVAELAVDVLPRMGLAGAHALAPFVENRESPIDLRFRALRALRAEGTADELGSSLLEIVKRTEEDTELRALALALALTVGSPFNSPEAVSLVLPIALSATDMEHQSAAMDGLVALGPDAASAVRRALVGMRVPQYTFNRLVSALPAMAHKDATKELQSLMDTLTGADRDDERAMIAQMLGRHAPAGLADFFVTRWPQMGPTSRRESLRVFRGRSDTTRELCEIALPDTSQEVRRAAFELALETSGVTSERCIEAVCAETEPAQYSEFLEMLSRKRPDNTVRGFLLGLLKEADSELFESLTSALDVYAGDAEVVAALVAQHERAHLKQIQQDVEEAHVAWRVRRMTIRAISRIGGDAAVEFLRLRSRSERAIDDELARESIRGLASLAPDDPVLLDLLDAPSLPKVKIEAAIAVAARGRGQGLRTLAREVRNLDSDTRRRALDALSTAHSLELRSGFLKLLALDEQARFGEENRADAIRDLATMDDPEAITTLTNIAREDRSTDARMEAIQALGRRGGDESARVLLTLGELILGEPESEERELLLQSVANALGNTHAALSVPRLMAHLFERPLRDARAHLLTPDVTRQPFERRRLYDRERAAARAIARIGSPALSGVNEWLRRMWSRGLLAVMDPTFMLDLAEEWMEVLPEASEVLAEVAGSFGQDLEPRFRALLIRAQLTHDRRRAATLYDSAHSLAASGAVEKAFARILGSAEAQWGRRPRIWLRCARLVARADAAFVEGKNDEGVRFLEEAIRRGAFDTRTLMDVAASFHSHGMAVRSREVVSQAVALAPSDHTLVESFAWLCLELNEPETALERFRLAETLDEDGAAIRGARFGAASALATLKRTDEAVAILRTLIRDDAEFADALRASPWLQSVRDILEPPSASRPASAPAEKKL